MKESDFVAAFQWPLAKNRKDSNQAEPLYKHDEFLQSIELLRNDNRVWAPIEGTTKRNEPETKLVDWISKQNSRLESLITQKPSASSDKLHLDLFPKDEEKPEKRILTISKNIVYLIDHTSDLLICMEKAFGSTNMKKAKTILSEDWPVFLYITNSVTNNGRAFKGDPFTGQLAAYSHIFAHSLLNEKERYVVCYYPHQLWSQFFDFSMKMPRSKGTVIVQSVSDVLLASYGVPINAKEWCLL